MAGSAPSQAGHSRPQGNGVMDRLLCKLLCFCVSLFARLSLFVVVFWGLGHKRAINCKRERQQINVSCPRRDWQNLAKRV